MGKQKVTVTDNSIKSGVTSDVNKAICEYIWNGFDAHAHHVSVEYQASELGNITSLVIKDDGDGISRATLSETFGRYQDSVKKKSFQWSSQVKGHRGKGRYSFNCFATGAEWVTVFREEDGKLIQHVITINGDDNDHYNDHSDEDGPKVVKNVPTGTEVRFINVEKLSSDFFASKDFISYLQREFAVFLKLNDDLGEVEVSQVKTYMGLIYDEPRFNSPDAQWTFILVGNKLDKTGFITREIKNSATWGKKNLIQHVDDAGQHYDIYVRTWSSIFDDFEIRHKFLLDKLEMKRKELTARYKDKEDLHKIVEEAKE